MPRTPEATPPYTPQDAFLPPEVARRRFPGPAWADQRNTVQHYGALTKAELGPGWQLAAGLFRSTSDSSHNYAQNFTAMCPDGTGARRITSDPPQSLAGTSGELRLSRYGGDVELVLPRADVEAVTNADDRALVGSGSYQINAPHQLMMFLSMDL